MVMILVIFFKKYWDDIPNNCWKFTKSYNAGEFNNFNVSEYLRCLQGTFNLCSKRFLKPFIIYGAAINQLQNEDIKNYAKEIALTLTDEMYNPDKRYENKQRK